MLYFQRAAAILAALMLGSCGGGNDFLAEGGQCQICRSGNPRCDTGLSCSSFRSDVTTYSLCAKPGTQNCPVPF